MRQYFNQIIYQHTVFCRCCYGFVLMYVVDGWCIWKYKLLVMVFMGMYIQVIGLLTTNVYVFFHQVKWPCLIWQGKRCFKFRTTNCSAQLWCFMLFVFVNVISCSWEFNPKYPDVNKQYLDSKALPTVPTGESLCLWSRTARELPASRLVTARTARWWGFKCDRCAGRVDGCGVGIGARLFGMHVI